MILGPGAHLPFFRATFSTMVTSFFFDGAGEFAFIIRQKMLFQTIGIYWKGRNTCMRARRNNLFVIARLRVLFVNVAEPGVVTLRTLDATLPSLVFN